MFCIKIIMNSRIYFFSFSSVFLLLVTSSLTVQFSFHKNRVHLLSDYFGRFVRETCTPCMQVGFSFNGTDGWGEAFGSGADIENMVPCTMHTMLHVASVSKSIGSGLVASLVEQGKLDWDANISKYLPAQIFPPQKYKGQVFNITLRQLITHQAGIRGSKNEDFLHDWEFHVKNSTDLLGWFVKDPLLFKPGHGYYYSNNGWSIIGAIVESVTNRPYYSVLEDYMSNIVKMPTATSETRERLIPFEGRQYEIIGSEPFYPPVQDLTRPFPHWPAGAVLANVHDLLVYGRRILHAYKTNDPEGLLKQSTLKEMWSYENGHVSMKQVQIKLECSEQPIKNITSRYVMGWQRRDFPHISAHNLNVLSKLKIFSHTGQVESVNAKLAIIPEYDFVFAAILNRGMLKEQMDQIPVDTFYTLFH